MDFKIDIEDPERHIQDQIDIWKSTSVGQWVKEHCFGNLEIHQMNDPHQWFTLVKVVAIMSDQDAVYWNLKYK